ncbi:MAG: hypothetical protein OIF50_00465 [Flavobacteriaceae bacterium]|nr:hypothetical protein [Flavobacteriaceae bacterium]
MGAEVIIVPAIFGGIFGIWYLFISARHSERMALINKGADASIFFSKKKKRITPLWKILSINLGCLSIGIGLGTLFGGLLDQLDFANRAVIPSCIFLMAGAGLLGGFFLTKKMTS